MSEDPFVKRVDEEWKERVSKEKASFGSQAGPTIPKKESISEPPAGEAAASQADFSAFLSSLAMQALVALGELPNPATHQPQIDWDQARYLIDMLGLLQEKTKGNLTPEESELLENALYELRMKYAAKRKG